MFGIIQCTLWPLQPRPATAIRAPQLSFLSEHHLQRFIDAQAGSYDQALAELHAGRKTSHWMWYIFPQIAGLGRSTTAQHYAIAGLAEAGAYLAHPHLGPRLEECTHAALQHERLHPEQLLGTIDALKFRSSMTLFAEAALEPALYRQALRAFYANQPDPLTLQLLGKT